MKRILLLTAIFSTFVSAHAQQDVPAYDGHRTLADFQQDTVRYLQYNWGAKVGGAYDNMHLSDFFGVFELPIHYAEIRCGRPGGLDSQVLNITLWLLPQEEIEKRIQLREEICRKSY